MEFLCPACSRWTTIPENQVLVGSRCRCHRCAEVLLVVSTRPFDVATAESTERVAERIGGWTKQKGANRG